MSLQIVLKHSSVQDKNPTAGQLGVAELAANLHESGPFLSIKDATDQVWRIGGVVISDDPPLDPTKGTWFFHRASNKLFLYDGGAFKLIGGGTGGGGAVPPTGQLIAGNGVAANFALQIQTIDQGVI